MPIVLSFAGSVPGCLINRRLDCPIGSACYLKVPGGYHFTYLKQ